jgi:hypothetical protein
MKPAVRPALALVAAAVVSAACSVSGGFVRDARGALDLRIDVANVQYLRTVSGTAEVGSVLCAIPLEDGAYDRAMRALNGSANLGPNQVVLNLREDRSVVTFLVYCLHRVTISGDVVELSSRSSLTSGSSAYLSDAPIEPDWESADVDALAPLEPASAAHPAIGRDDATKP